MARILIFVSLILVVQSTSQYAFSVFEEAPVGTYIGKVTLSGALANCTNSIYGSQDFSIDSSGCIYTSAMLDREARSQYTLRVACNDSAIPVADIRVAVIDINDNAPVFSQSVYTIYIRDDIVPGTEIGHVSATDGDFGLNGDITYRLQSGRHFVINKRTGYISLLERPKESLYVLHVVAQDAGQPYRSTFCNVYIIVPRSYKFKILESAPVHSSLGSVFKLPSGTAATLPEIQIRPHVPFTLDLTNNNGSLYTGTLLDREVISVYFFQVLMSTHAVDSLLANVTIDVLDVNDNSPVFSQNMYHVTVNAESLGLSPFLTVQAIDADSGSKLTYSIATKSDPQLSPFTIDNRTGTLSAIRTLHHSNYTVQVQVSDGLFTSQAWVYITAIFIEEVVG